MVATLPHSSCYIYVILPRSPECNQCVPHGSYAIYICAVKMWVLVLSKHLKHQYKYHHQWPYVDICINYIMANCRTSCTRRIYGDDRIILLTFITHCFFNMTGISNPNALVYQDFNWRYDFTWHQMIFNNVRWWQPCGYCVKSGDLLFHNLNQINIPTHLWSHVLWSTTKISLIFCRFKCTPQVDQFNLQGIAVRTNKHFNTIAHAIQISGSTRNKELNLYFQFAKSNTQNKMK